MAYSVTGNNQMCQDGVHGMQGIQCANLKSLRLVTFL